MGIIDLIEKEGLEITEIKDFSGHLINSGKEPYEIIKYAVEKAQNIYVLDKSGTH